VNIVHFTVLLSIVLVQSILNGYWWTEATINQVDKNPMNPQINYGTKPIQIKQIVLELPEGHKLGRIEMGVLCIPMTDLKSIGGKAKVSENDFTDVVKTVLENADYSIIDDTSVDSQTRVYEDELVLKGIVKELKANLCFPKSGFRSWKISKGEAYVKIHWQMHSNTDDKILFEKITEGSERLTEAIAYGSTKVIRASVAVATQNLIADENFNMVVTKLN
jgi:hypothetical protein